MLFMTPSQQCQIARGSYMLCRDFSPCLLHATALRVGAVEQISVDGHSLRPCWCVIFVVGGLQTVNDSTHWNWSDISPVIGAGWQSGGEWKPADCVARYHMAVVIPFRDRDSHLIALLRHLIPLLQRQMIHFRIFVVEQVMITFRVRGSRGELCSGYGRQCLSVPRRIPTLLNRPECKFGNGRCPLVVHFVSDIAIFVLKRDVKLQVTNLVVHY